MPGMMPTTPRSAAWRFRGHERLWKKRYVPLFASVPFFASRYPVTISAVVVTGSSGAASGPMGDIHPGAGRAERSTRRGNHGYSVTG